MYRDTSSVDCAPRKYCICICSATVTDNSSLKRVSSKMVPKLEVEEKEQEILVKEETIQVVMFSD